MPSNNSYYGASLPIIGPNGHSRERIHVATELGVKVFFDLQTQEFQAKFGPSGDEANLHGPSLQAVVDRIRDRALVTPVDAYHVNIDGRHIRGGSHEYRVIVEPVRVVQYHHGRQYPYVVEETSGNGATVLRSRQEVMLPTEQDIAVLKEIAELMTEEEQRHREREEELKALRTSRIAAVARLSPTVLRYVQRGGEQPVVPGLGVEDVNPEDAFIGPEEVAASDAAHEAFVNENLDRGVDIRE